MVRTQELDNSIDETLWVEINAKDQSFLCRHFAHMVELSFMHNCFL
jgi:hypothetical protein